MWEYNARFRLRFLLDIKQFLVTSADCLKGERLLKPPWGAAQSRVLWVRILYSYTLKLSIYIGKNCFTR